MASPTSKYRRHLPHLRREGAIYLITWVLRHRDRPLSEDDRGMVMDSIRFFDGTRYELKAAVVMDDHVHVLVRPGQGFELSKLVHSWKSFSAHELVKRGRTAPVWLDEYHDTIIREGPHYQQARDYIRLNPVKRWPEVREYRWLLLNG